VIAFLAFVGVAFLAILSFTADAIALYEFLCKRSSKKIQKSVHAGFKESHWRRSLQRLLGERTYPLVPGAILGLQPAVWLLKKPNFRDIAF
jgi:hypothetical protein